MYFPDQTKNRLSIEDGLYEAPELDCDWSDGFFVDGVLADDSFRAVEAMLRCCKRTNARQFDDNINISIIENKNKKSLAPKNNEIKIIIVTF